MPSLNLTDQTFDTWDKTAKDSAVLLLGTQEPASILTNCTIDGSLKRQPDGTMAAPEWGLKMPGNRDSVVSNCRLIGGKERALDMVKGQNVRFNDCVFSAGGARSPVTSKWALGKACDIGIKGGASDITFKGCVLNDLLLGDHSIYDNPSGVGPRTTRIVLDGCSSPTGGPIIVRLWNADLPTLSNGTKAIALQWNGLILKTYFWVAGKWIDNRMPT